MSATSMSIWFKSREELENKIQKIKLEKNPKDPNRVNVELPKEIDSIVFDGSKQYISVAVTF